MKSCQRKLTASTLRLIPLRSPILAHIKLMPEKEFSMAKNYYITGNRKDGYKSVAEGAERASFTSDRQSKVIAITRETMRNQGGGELRIQGQNGRFRAADTVPPKKDNFPPRG